MGYDYDYITRLHTNEDVLNLLSEIEADEARIDQIVARYGEPPRFDQEYDRLVDRIRTRFSLAEHYAAEIEAREGYDDDDYYPQEMKSPYLPKMNYKSADPEFVKWADEQIKLANMWDWGE